ncbi:MAG: HAD-IIB family hydrolase [Actinomycetales bacterium]|nr:HAD-IIB family hydrolase [Actinomycetales bacterium]
MSLPDGLRPRIIAVDLDGTLVPPSGDVPEGVAQAIERVQTHGAIVVAATGRSLSTTAYVARDAGMHEFAVVSNGAMIVTVDPESVIEADTFDAGELLAELTELFPDATFAVERDDGVFLSTRHFVDRGVSLDVREVPYAELTRDPVVRVIVRSEDHLDRDLGALVAHLDMHSIAFGVTDVAWLDLGIKGVTKATGLQKLCARLGVGADDVLAIGDAMNDIEMLRWAGYSVAMPHARPDIKAIADHVTDGGPGVGVISVLDRLYR